MSQEIGKQGLWGARFKPRSVNGTRRRRVPKQKFSAETPAIEDRTRVWYEAYLGSRVWYYRRQRLIRERGRRCEECHREPYVLTRKAAGLPARSSLILHHLTYERVGNESDEDLRLLCKECHHEAHRVKIPFGISWLRDQTVVTGIR